MGTSSLVPAFLLASSTPSAGTRLINAIFDETPFVGIHRLVLFDWLILIPYFAVLFVLSLYGLHRYEMIRGYWKHRKQLPETPPYRFDELPPITIQLPIFNERYVVERLLEETSKIDYPRKLLQIQVLDDSTDDTHPFTDSLVPEFEGARADNRSCSFP